MKIGLRLGGPLLAVAICLLAVTAASAAEHRENKWFYGANMGGGSGGLHVGSESADREVGALLSLRAGYGFQNDRTVGVDFATWLSNVSDVDQNYYILGPFLTWYPGDRGVFVRGEFGIGSISFQAPGAEEIADWGIGAMATVGYEFQIVRTVTFTSQADYGFVHTGEETWADMVNFSLGFAWYPAKK